MRVIKGVATNFGSYKRFEFNFSTPGLHLISGPTGAGKSTVCDLIPWTLFGITAKNGAANEIMSWGSDEPTNSTISLKLHGEDGLVVSRTRGKNSDLFFYRLSDDIQNDSPTRGKDLKDTQRLLNEALGLTPGQYLASAYYHEMSDTAQFFSTTAKNRRDVTEQLVDLSQVIKAQKGLADQLKTVASDLRNLSVYRNGKETSLLVLQKTIDRTLLACRSWDEAQANKLVDLENKAFSFDSEKTSKIEKILNNQEVWDADNRQTLFQLEKSLDTARLRMMEGRIALAQLETQRDAFRHSETCPTCGSKVDSAEREEANENYVLALQLAAQATTKVQQIESSLDMQKTIQNPYNQQLELAKASTNPYLNQLRSAMSHELNPHLDQLAAQRQLEEQNKEELSDATAAIQDKEHQQRLLNVTKELTDKVRTALIETSIAELQNETNRLLETHFDAAMRIEFSAEEFDKLEVSITKDGHACNYTQLSKGQRQMLRLCFAISCMKTSANRSGVKVEQVFLDEALDGLDDILKVKSFGLLEELSRAYNSVYVVEHNSDLKTLFTSRFEVSLNDGHSQIEKIV